MKWQLSLDRLIILLIAGTAGAIGVLMLMGSYGILPQPLLAG